MSTNNYVYLKMIWSTNTYFSSNIIIFDYESQWLDQATLFLLKIMIRGSNILFLL